MYYKILNEESLQFDPERTHIHLSNNLEDCDYVEDPDGRIIPMVDVRKILSKAEDAIIETFAPGMDKIFSNMRLIPTYNNCKTLFTDGERISYNPTFIWNIYNLGRRNTQKGAIDRGLVYIAYLLMHEAYHIILLHCRDTRARKLLEKDAESNKICNYCMDLVINWLIECSSYDAKNKSYPFDGVTKEIGGVIYDPETDSELFSYDWNDIYDKIDPERALDFNNVIIKHIDPVPTKQSQEWYNGFLEGYKYIFNRLQTENLIESKIHLYISPLLESDRYSNSEKINVILADETTSSEEKAMAIYNILGGNINGDKEVNQDIDINDNSYSSNNMNDQYSDNDNSYQDTSDIKDLNNETVYERGRIYGITFALYTYNCNGDAEYVINNYFPHIKLPLNVLPVMKKRNKGYFIDINQFVDLNKLTDDLLKSGKFVK